MTHLKSNITEKKKERKIEFKKLKKTINFEEQCFIKMFNKNVL
jgi:hypothetical protein